MTSGEKVILIVEDSPTIRLLLTLQLKSLGWLVEEAFDGAEALRKFQDKRYAAILMDIQIPVIDGLETTILIRQIEASEQRTRTPIIALTAGLRKDECLNSGIDDYLLKPMLVDDLKEKLDAWVAPRMDDT